ncbi:hypothetical protein ANCDUO_04406, partial [Ancylostoma duodenale]
ANTLYDLNVSSQKENLGKSLLDGFYTKEPPHYMVPFTEGIHPNEKLDQALEWLKLDDDKRPGLIMVYIIEPDHTGHLRMGEKGKKLDDALVLVEKALQNFFAKLRAQNILECVNILIICFGPASA